MAERTVARLLVTGVMVWTVAGCVAFADLGESPQTAVDSNNNGANNGTNNGTNNGANNGSNNGANNGVVFDLCDDDDDCRGSEICALGYCLDACEDDQDCEPTHYCEEGACVPSVCNDDLDCLPEQICDVGSCEFPCERSGDACFDWGVCHVGQDELGLCYDMCEEDADCSSDLCAGGACLFDCADDDDCQTSELCLDDACVPCNLTPAVDDWTEAELLPEMGSIAGSLCAGTVAWYSVPVQEGELIVFTVTSQTPWAMRFEGGTDPTGVGEQPVDDIGEALRYELLPEQSGSYYVRLGAVLGADKPLSVSYSIKIERSAPCTPTSMTSWAAPKPANPNGDTQLELCPGQVGWMSVDVGQGDLVGVSLSGPPEMEVELRQRVDEAPLFAGSIRPEGLDVTLDHLVMGRLVARVTNGGREPGTITLSSMRRVNPDPCADVLGSAKSGANAHPLTHGMLSRLVVCAGQPDYFRLDRGALTADQANVQLTLASDRPAALKWSVFVPGSNTWLDLPPPVNGMTPSSYDATFPEGQTGPIWVRVEAPNVSDGAVPYRLDTRLPTPPAISTVDGEHSPDLPTLLRMGVAEAGTWDPGAPSAEREDHFEVQTRPTEGAVRLVLNDDFPIAAGLSMVVTRPGGEVVAEAYGTHAQQTVAFPATGETFRVVVRGLPEASLKTQYTLVREPLPECPAAGGDDHLEGSTVNLDRTVVAEAWACPGDTDTFELGVQGEASGMRFVVEPLGLAEGLIADAVVVDGDHVTIERGTYSRGGPISVSTVRRPSDGRYLLQVSNRAGEAIGYTVRAVPTYNGIPGCDLQWLDQAAEGFGFLDALYRDEVLPFGNVLPAAPWYGGYLGSCAGQLDDRVALAFYRHGSEAPTRIAVTATEGVIVEWWLEDPSNDRVVPTGPGSGGFVTWSGLGPGWYVLNIRSVGSTPYAVVMAPPSSPGGTPSSCDSMAADVEPQNNLPSNAGSIAVPDVREPQSVQRGRVCEFDLDHYALLGNPRVDLRDVLYTLAPVNPNTRPSLALDVYEVVENREPLSRILSREYANGPIHFGAEPGAPARLLRVRLAGSRPYDYTLSAQTFDCDEAAEFGTDDDDRSRAQLRGQVDMTGSGVAQSAVLCSSPTDAGDWYVWNVGNASAPQALTIRVTNNPTSLSFLQLTVEVERGASIIQTLGNHDGQGVAVQVMTGDKVWIRISRVDTTPSFNVATPYELRLTPN